MLRYYQNALHNQYHEKVFSEYMKQTHFFRSMLHPFSLPSDFYRSNSRNVILNNDKNDYLLFEEQIFYNINNNFSIKKVFFSDIKMCSFNTTKNDILREIYFFNISLIDFKNIKNFSNLEWLMLDNVLDTKNFNNIAQLKNLQLLMLLNDVNICNDDYEVISFLPNLTKLYIYNDNFDNLSFLKNHFSLDTLRISNKYIDELLVMNNFRNLQCLHIDGKCSECQIDKLKKHLPNCKIHLDNLE